MTPFIAAALLACSCGAQATQTPGSAGSVAPAALHLNGTHWRFVKVAGTRVPQAITATLQFKDGHASGKAGCNAYGATYAIAADGSAHFRKGMSTQMACLTPPGAMRVQRGIYAAFRQAVKVAERDGKLELLDAAGKPLASLVPVATPAR